MEYEYTLTVPAGTAKASAVSTVCKLAKGILHHCEIVFPEGCNNLVEIAVFNGGFQCIPLNPDGSIKGNADPVEMTTFYPLESEPYELKVKGWAVDTSYAHKIIIRFDILPREYFDRTASTESLVKAVTSELQREFLEASGGIAEILQGISRQITPAVVPAGPDTDGPEVEDHISDEKAIDKLTLGQIAAVRSQVKRGWTIGQIIDANIRWIDLSEDNWVKVIQELRNMEDVNHG